MLCQYVQTHVVISVEEDFDFTAAQQQVSVGDAPVDVQVFLRADRRALEPDEQFQLRLETDDALQNNEFLQDTITIIIVDNDSKYHIVAL